MIATSPEFALTVEGVEMQARYRVEVDLPDDVYPDVTLTCTSVSVDESTTTDQPANTRDPVGFPAASADITLSGSLDPDDETVTVGSIFSPYQTTSPLYRKKLRGCAVRIFMGLIPAGGPEELLRKFTGTIDSYEYNPADGTVALTCIDRRNELRSSVDVPAVVTAAPFNAGLTSEFAVDALLRSATGGAVSSWPAQRADCVLAVGMRASLWPEVGILRTDLSQPAPAFAPGAFGSALAHLEPSDGGWPLAYFGLSGALSADVLVECWTVIDAAADTEPTIKVGSIIGTSFPGSGPAVVSTAGMYLLVASDRIRVQVGASFYEWTVSVTDGPHYVAAAVTFDLVTFEWSAQIRLDGVTQSTGTIAQTLSITTPADPWTMVQVDLFHGTIEAVQVSGESSPTFSDSFAPRAVLDPSLNTLQVIPAITGDPWQTIQQIADAEQAVAGWDQAADVFRFTNRRTIRTGTVARTIRATESLLSLAIGVDGSGFADDVQIPYTAWRFGARTIVWSLADVKKVPRNSSITILATLDQLAGALDVTPIWLPDSGVTPGGSYYRSSSDQFGTASGGRIICTVAQTSAEALTITATNPTNLDAWLISSAAHVDLPVGTPCLQIGGQPVLPVAEQSAEHTTGLGMTAYQGQSNPWIQDEATADRIAVDLLSNLAVERPNLTGIGIVPDPRLQLIDRVRIQDPVISGIDEYAVMFGQTISLDVQDGTPPTVDYTHTIDARAVAKPGGWILGVADRSTLAVSTSL